MARPGRWGVGHWVVAALLITASSAASSVEPGGREVRHRDAATIASAPHHVPDEAVGPAASSPFNAVGRAEAGDLAAVHRAAKLERDPAVRAVLDEFAAAARLDLAVTRGALARGRRAGAAPAWKAVGFATLVGAAFADGRYAEAAQASAAWLSLPPGTDPLHRRDEVAQLHELADELSRLCPQALVTPVRGATRTWRDKADLLRARVRIGGREQEVVLDTGANLSVMTSSTARRLGLRVLGSARVRSSSRDGVAARLAVAPRLRIGDTEVANVKFLVLDEAALTMPLPGSYSIPAIIGFPVFLALGQATFNDGMLLLGRAVAGDRPGVQLVASGSDLFASVRVNGVGVPLHLDSGASRTTLSARFADEHPDLVRGLPKRISRSAGTGVSESPASVLAGATVEIGDCNAHLPEIEIAVAGDRATYGALGQDVLRSARSYTVDLRRMHLVVAR